MRSLALLTLNSIFVANGFILKNQNAFSQKLRHRKPLIVLDMAKIGLFFGTSTGNTETVAEMIAEQFGDDVDGPIDIEASDKPVTELLTKYDALIVGTPTWNTGADTERSGTGWDEIYYTSMQDLQIAGKKVAVFGLGDQISYGENYADATGELHDVFENLGCTMMGYTSQEGYEHEASKSIRGDKFCGLLLDMINQEDLTEERVQNWVVQLKEEGILDGSSRTSVPAADSGVPEPEPEPVVEDGPSTAAAVSIPSSLSSSMEDIIAQLEKENAELRRQLGVGAAVTASVASAASPDGYTPHSNAKTGRTMWTSPDGRSCYFTEENSSTFSP